MQLSGNILITGGAGSIGRAIIRRAQRERWPAEITIFSRSEYLQAALRQHYPHVRCVLGDVRDRAAVMAAVAGHTTVIHAAAMKRIPECEAQPLECSATNVLGTQHVIDACVMHGVATCVGISTDKAVRATTVYGGSKLAMERLFTNAARTTGRRFVVARYGNVVASRGSVIPIWRAAAAAGQPLPITDPLATRYWFGIEQAVDVVLHTATEIPNGHILVPELPALRLCDLAAIIAPGSALDVIGWRSVEKLHEELLHADELVTRAPGVGWLVGSGASGVSHTSERAHPMHGDAFLAALDAAEEYSW